LRIAERDKWVRTPVLLIPGFLVFYEFPYLSLHTHLLFAYSALQFFRRKSVYGIAARFSLTIEPVSSRILKEGACFVQSKNNDR
jgi:hypothetical protein